MSKSIAPSFVSVFTLGAALTFAGATRAQGKPPAAAPGKPAGAAAQTSTEADRKTISLTVYNQNFGVVREVRELPALGTGQVALEFRDVAANIQPETVAIKSLSAPGSISVLEQNYRYDLLTPQTLLEKYVGKKIR